MKFKLDVTKDYFYYIKDHSTKKGELNKIEQLEELGFIGEGSGSGEIVYDENTDEPFREVIYSLNDIRPTIELNSLDELLELSESLGYSLHVTPSKLEGTIFNKKYSLPIVEICNK